MVSDRTSPDESRARPERRRSTRPLALALLATLAALGLAVLRRRRPTPLLEPPF